MRSSSITLSHLCSLTNSPYDGNFDFSTKAIVTATQLEHEVATNRVNQVASVLVLVSTLTLFGTTTVLSVV